MDYKNKKEEENKALIETLIADLNNEDWMVRERAVETLRDIKGNRSIEPLIIALNDRDLDIQTKALMGLREVTGQEFGRDAEKWRLWWANNRPTFKDNKTSDTIDAKWLYNQVWKYHEHNERDNLLEALFFLSKNFPDSEETIMAFKSFASSNYFNKEEQKKLRPLFNKYKEIENAACPKCGAIYSLGTKCKCENKINAPRAEEATASSISRESKPNQKVPSFMELILNDEILRFTPLLAILIIFKRGIQSVPYIAPIVLSCYIYYDSKKRLGTPNWGWIIFSFSSLVIGWSLIQSQIPTGQDFNIAGLLGSIFGACLGYFSLYRAVTKKAAKAFAEKGETVVFKSFSVAKLKWWQIIILVPIVIAIMGLIGSLIKINK